jgi:hypothetical protein
VAKPARAPVLVTTESAKEVEHPPTTVCGGANGRIAAEAGVVAARSAVNATAAARADRRSTATASLRASPMPPSAPVHDPPLLTKGSH